MKTERPKLKTATRPLFSCGLFRHCTRTVLSPTTSNPPVLPISFSDPPPLPQQPPQESCADPSTEPHLRHDSSSSSSSSNTSQSFTQWKFPLPNSPISPHPHPPRERDLPTALPLEPNPQPPILTANVEELFHVAELQLSSGSDADGVQALHMLERSLVPNPVATATECPAVVMRGLMRYLKEKTGAKAATKVLLALCLGEGNRRVAVEAGAAGEVVEALAELEGAAAERALAALELLCTVAEGAAEVRAHALAVPMMVEEYAISVLAVIYGGDATAGMVAPPEEVARAVALALQGECSARGRRKGAQLLKALQESGRLDLTQGGR
ncbi:Ubiquitin--protein ligase [Bertholletia excelsa]